MACKGVHTWSLIGLVVAFIDLAITYTLLCIAAFSFLPSKFLEFFGLYFPCPCNGVFGYENTNLCFHKLFVDFPLEKISSVQGLVKRNFPFDFIWFHDHRCNLHGIDGVRSRENRNFELENGVGGESSSTYDVKGKRVVSVKGKRVVRAGTRRRRKGGFGYGKWSPVLAESVVPLSVSVGDHSFPCERSSIKGRDLKEIVNNGVDECLIDYANGTDSEKGNACSLDGKSIVEDRLCSGNFTRKAEEGGLGRSGDDMDVIKTLRQALEEEKNARKKLYQELEKERAAAATAADEAMAMILRLQEDKASVEIEARQYQRMVEEKCTYDEEEMDILKEILVRREKENHFLEKELEAYRQMNLLGNEHQEGNAEYDVDLKQIPDQTEDSSSGKRVVETNCFSSCEQVTTPGCRELITSKREGIDYDLSTQLLQQKPAPFSGQEKAQDVGISRLEVTETDSEIEEELEKDRENCNIDSESAFYDVHVIDDVTTFRKENDRMEFGFSDLSVPTINSKEETHPSIISDLSSTTGTSNDLVNITLTTHSQRATSPSLLIDDERSKIGCEVQRLREWLRVVQEEKEKPTFSGEHSELLYTQLEVVDEILHQLQEIQQLREPTQQPSLPASSSKVNTKKRSN